MSSRRGLSAEEKKVKMLEIFHEKSEFFTLKELEKLGAKRGVVMQTIKDVVQDLCDDNLIQFDKIGTSNFFWSFTSAAGATKQAALTKAKKELESIQVKIEETSEVLDHARKGREDTAERRRLLTELETANQLSENYKAELAAFGAADPVKYEKKTHAIQVCKDAALRWTDNTMMVIQVAGSVGGMEPGEIKTYLDIKEDWEDLIV